MELNSRSQKKRCWSHRLWTFALVFTMLTFVAKGHAEQRIKLIIDKGKLEQAITKIRTTYNVVIAYNKNDIENINVKAGTYNNTAVEEILTLILKETSITYKKNGASYVLLKRKTQNTPPLHPVQLRQPGPVLGKVADEKGEALPGVIVAVRGTSMNTITDAEGKYSFSSIPDDAVLLFSMVGMKKHEVTIGGKSIVDVVLSEESVVLNEVVAVGYGNINRKNLTGAVSSVNANTIRDMPVTSIADAIAGRMAGVQVSRTEGAPDAAIKIRVRGGGSITQDNSPLYIVDGFPVDDISYISPADIASIDVLKDASSTAIYGARGANGVILVTTKEGHVGKGRVSFNSYYGWKKMTKMLDVLNPYEYIYWQYELQNTNSAIDRYFGDFADSGLYKEMKGTNWQKEIFGQTGTSFSNNLSLSGGNKGTTYNINLTRNDEKEIMIGSGYTRTNLTVNTSHEINNWLSINLNSRLSDYQLKGAGTSSGTRLSHAVQFRPVNGLMDFVDTSLDDGDYETTSAQVLNPLMQTLDDYRRKNRLGLNFNGAATIKLSNDLDYRMEYGVQYGRDNNTRFYGINTSDAAKYGKQPVASIEGINSISQRQANVLTYTKNGLFPNQDLTLMVGQELNYSKFNSIFNTSKYFPKYMDAAGALNMMNLGSPDPTQTFDNPAVKIASFFGRANYSLKDKYLASATFRADGSSKFVPGKRWGYFPSAALAWRIIDEDFMSVANTWLDDLKLRFSYGASGNNRIPDNAWQKTYTVGSGGIYMDGDGEGSSPTPFLQPNSVLSNPNLKWETTITQNIGLDFGVFKHRVYGTLEVYKNITKDLLISAVIPSNTGYSNQWQNIGQTSNKGLEITINGDIVKNTDFQLSASFNIGFNRNRIDKLGNTKRWEQSTDWFTSNSGPSGEYLIEEGGQVGLMYGYQTDGMYSFDDFNYSEGVYTLKPGVPDDRALLSSKRFWPGALKLKDQNGDGLVNAVHDKVIIGNANPKHTGGFNLSSKYKSFDFSAFFNWSYGNHIYNANKLYFSMSATGYTYKNILNTMNSDNRFIYIDKTSGALVSDPIQLAQMNKNATIWSSAMNYAALHSWVIEDGSFLRLNNLTLGYSIPKSILNKLHLQKLRIYGTAYNVSTWTKYTGYDPEVDTRRATPLTPGIDWNAYPRSRNFNIGLNVEF